MTTKKALLGLLREARDLLAHDGKSNSTRPCPGCELQAKIDAATGE